MEITSWFHHFLSLKLLCPLSPLSWFGLLSMDFKKKKRLEEILRILEGINTLISSSYIRFWLLESLRPLELFLFFLNLSLSLFESVCTKVKRVGSDKCFQNITLATSFGYCILLQLNTCYFPFIIIFFSFSICLAENLVFTWSKMSH